MTVMPEREGYFAGAYWGPRKESPEECAQRTAAFLDLLASCDPFLAEWFGPARSRRDARRYPLMPPDVPTLAEWFRRGANRFLSLPRQGPNAERVLASPVLREVVRSMALAWEPDWAVAMSLPHRDLTEKEGKAEVWLGWVTYLSRRRGLIPPLPAPVRVEPVAEQGSLIILTPERFTATRPEHIALASQVRHLLQGAGVLPPPR